MAVEDRPRREIGFFTLFILIFSAVGSGPAGIEGLISSAGLTIALISVVVFPFFWGYVQALISAELSIKYKHLNGAIGTWINQLFGRAFAQNAALWFILMQCSTASFVSEVTVTYIEAFWPGTVTLAWQKIFLTLVIIGTSACINALGIARLGRAMTLLSLNSLAAFATLVGVAARRGPRWGRFDNPMKPVRNINWSQFVNLLIYNSAGYDSTATIIAHVHNPRVNLPAAMVLVGACVSVLYVAALTFPFLATSDPASSWDTGYFTVAARELGGEWLAGWITFSCVATNLQVYMSSLMTASHTVQSMAAQAIFSDRLGVGAAGTPHSAIILCAIASFVFGCVPLTVNLAVESILYVLLMMAQIAVFLRANDIVNAMPAAAFSAVAVLVATFAVIAVGAAFTEKPYSVAAVASFAVTAFCVGMLSIGRLWRRRLCMAAPLAVSVWVLVVQNEWVALPTLSCVATLALWSMPEEKPLLPDEAKRLMYRNFDALPEDTREDVLEALRARSGGVAVGARGGAAKSGSVRVQL